LPATTFQIFYDDFESNLGAAGGALDIELRPMDALAIVGGTFIRNTAATSGGAVNARSGQASIAHSMFKANTAATGAAIAEAPEAQLTVVNSLIVENTAPSSAAVTGSQLVLQNVTVANNRASGIAADTPAESKFTNLLLSQNQPNNCSGFPAASFIGPNDQFGPTACGGSTVSGDPQLDSFYIPTPGNPVLVLGDAGACAKSPVDGTDLVFQARGKGVCALGAYERPPPQFKPPAPTQGPYAPKTAVAK
jgi:predicted outer membrane repeat protein